MDRNVSAMVRSAFQQTVMRLIRGELGLAVSAAILTGVLLIFEAAEASQPVADGKAVSQSSTADYP
jgi:type IV secretory pathway VirB2 component (pilin)